jgi:hypothetical protein
MTDLSGVDMSTKLYISNLDYQIRYRDINVRISFYLSVFNRYIFAPNWALVDHGM